MALLLVVNLFTLKSYKLLLLAVAIDFFHQPPQSPPVKVSYYHMTGLAFLSPCIMYTPYLSDMGLLGSVLRGPLGFYCTSHWICLSRLDHWGAPLKSRVYSSKQKCITICCSKWSYAVTQMSPTEKRWYMVTAVQASGGGVMVSGPFNWYTVGLLIATMRCL